MNELIQELHDIEMIKHLKHRYFRAIDMADHGLLDSVFTDDIRLIIAEEHMYGRQVVKKRLFNL